MKSVSSSLRYSPISACLKVAMPVGSRRRASAVEREVTPKPCRRSVNCPFPLRECGGVATYQGSVVHAVNHHALVLRAVLTPATNMCLENIAAVEERHLAVGLDPDLVAGVGRDGVEGGDVQAEFAGLGELANAGAEGEEVGAGDAGGQVGDALAHVVDATVLDAEDVAVVIGGVGGRDQVVQRAAGVVGQLREQRLGLSVCERPHCGRCARKCAGWSCGRRCGGERPTFCRGLA